MAARFDLLMFDLDGTLIDTSKDIAAAMNHVLRREGLAPLPAERVVQFVGHGVRRLIQRSMETLGASVDGREEEMYEAFVAWYRRHMLDTTRPYPGVIETLRRLEDRPMAIVTNKPAGPSREILEGLGVARFFSAVVGGDSLDRRKPDPLPVTHLLERFGVAPGRALLVGDTAVDIRTARAAGARSCAVTYGYAYQDDLSWADYTIGAFPELARIVGA